VEPTLHSNISFNFRSFLQFSIRLIALFSLHNVFWNLLTPPYALAHFARDLGYHGQPFTWDEHRRARLRADLDAFYARAYELDRDQLRYILDPSDVKGADYPSETFRVLKEREFREHDEYRTRRLVLEAWDRMEATGEFKALDL
jgi:hypothetical protein